MSKERPKIILCPEHEDRNGKPCGLCNGSQLMRLQSIKNRLDGSILMETYVPYPLTEEEAQEEWDRGIDVLCNNYKISD